MDHYATQLHCENHYIKIQGNMRQAWGLLLRRAPTLQMIGKHYSDHRYSHLVPYSEEFTDSDLINEIQLNEGIASSAAAVGLYFRQSNKLKKLDFSKPKDVGKGFGILA